jgi:NAD(P)-dependent dehydrogenase (short-subunit alcohol dehydrogenase family)
MSNIIQFGAQPNSIGGKISTLLKDEGHSVKNFDLVDGWDATDEETVKQILQTRGCEVVINYVGMMFNESISNMKIEDFQKVLNTNCLSLMVLLKQSSLYFQKNQIPGKFIHIASNASISGFSGMGAYCASKFADIGLIQVAAKEWMKFGGIVNAISPGPFTPESSEMSKNQVQQFMKMNNMTEKQAIDMLVSRIPLKRLCTISDLYPLIRFLACDSTDYITGQNFSLTGGMFMK